MKIVFCTLFRQSMGGGIGQLAYEMAPVFAEKHQVVFVVPGNTTRVKTVSQNLKILQVKNVGKRELAIPVLNYKNIKYVFNFLNSFSADVIHVHDPGPMSFLLQLWAQKSNTPFFYTSHILPTKAADFGAKDISGKIGKVIDSRLLKKYFLNFFHNCDGVIALNKFAKDDIHSFGYKGRMFQIPNGRDIRRYHLCKLADISEENKKLIFVGYLSRRKNQKYLLDVLKFLPKSYSLDLIGDKLENDYYKGLQNIIKKHNLNARLVGKVDHKDIAGYLENSHFFVSASKMEVQSLVVIEALAAGRPIIGLSNETIDELIDSDCGYRFPKDTKPQDFAKRVIKLSMLNKNDYKNLCLNAMKRAENFSWENVYQQTIEAYSKLIKEKKTKVSNRGRVEKIINKLGLKSFFKDKNEARDRELIRLFNSIKIKKLQKTDFYLFLLVIVTQLASSWYTVYENITNIKNKIKILTNS